MKIGDKIRKVRELKNFKQEAVAEKLGMSVTAYGNIERNDSNLTYEKLEEIAAVLEVSVADIINIPEQLNIHSIVNSSVGFNYYDHRTGNENSEIQAFQTEIAYLRKQNDDLLRLVERLSGTKP